MVAYHYDFRIALVKGSPNTVAANATVLVYDPTDTGMTTPVAMYSNPGMTTIINLVTDAHGVVPDFWSERPDLLWKSGTYSGGWATTSSRPGLRGPSGGAGPKGDKGDPGAPGLNGAGTNAEVAAFIPASGPTRDALDARYTPTSAMPTFIGANLPARLGESALNAAYAKKTSVDLSDYATLKAAIAALPSTGGTVYVPVGRFPAGDWKYDIDYMAKANVRIVGEKMPALSSNADRLENGSVIYGRFNAFADSLTVENIGFDLGKYTCDTSFGAADTHTANHPLGGTWDAFAFAQPNMTTPLPPRRNVKLSNIIGLLRDSQSVGHAVLMEGINGGTVDNAIGVGGVHAVVVKSQNMRLGRVSGWSASNNNVIFKADTYAPCGNISADSIESLTTPPNTTPWFTPAIASNGLLLNPASASFAGSIQVGSLKVMGARIGLSITGGAAYAVSDVQIGSIVADGYTGAMTTGVDFNTCRASRVQIGSLIVSNTEQGVAWAPATVGDNGAHQVHIGSAQFTNTSARALNASLYGRIRISSLEVTNANCAYYCEDNARVMIGKETLIGVNARWERNAPALAAGWTNFGSGNSTVEIKPANYGIEVRGLALKGSGATGVIINLPTYLRPPENMRLISMMTESGTNKTAFIGVDSGSSGVVINDGTPPVDGAFVSIDGVGWQHW